VLVGVAAALPRRASDDPIDRLIDRSRSPAERVARHVGWQVAMLFLAGAAVWVATAPLVLARFHVCSPVGLVVNVVVAPLVAVAMAAGFLCLLVAPCSTIAAAACGGLCDGALACLAAVVRVAADLPGGHWWTPGPPAWWVAGWYLLFAAALLWLPAPVLTRGRTWACLAAGWSAVWGAAAVVGGLVGPAPAGMRVVAAAVGHGCGIVVTSPEGRCLVFDAGRLGAASAARRAIAAVLWSEGHSRIDSLVISHADADHFNAVPELLERFAVGEVVVPAGFADGSSTGVADLLARIHRRGIPLRQVVAGDSCALDRGCRIRLLHPEAGASRAPIGVDGAAERRAADNEAGIVMAVEAAGRRLLLTGDIEGRAAAAFVAAGPDACDVLVAPHHGSRTSLPPLIAAATQPAAVLVSGQGGESWSEVRAAYATVAGIAEANVLRTGDEGAIALRIDATAITATRFADGAWRPVGPLARPTGLPEIRLPPVGAVASAQPPR
jgi:competence protein ComEC